MFVVVVCSRDARSAPSDPAARGLDAYVELPLAAAPGAKIVVDLRTFGFATAVEPSPLGDVEVEAAWQGSDAKPDAITTDRDGVAALALTMPDGKAEKASLMLAFSQGTHRRTRTFEIARAPKVEIELHIQEQEVAPGSRIPAWVLVRDLETGSPAPNVDLLLKLSEGGVDQTVVPLRTDAAGAASTAVSIPDAEDPSFGWQLKVDAVGVRSNGASAQLRPREDVPAQPTLVAGFDASRLAAGSKTAVHVRLSSATGEGIARAELRYLFTDGGDGKEATDQDWEKQSKLASTDEAGELVIPYDVPSLGFATQKRVTVRAVVDGRQREATSVLEVVAKVAPTVELFAEAGLVVPGLEQLLIVRAKDGWDKPVAGAELRVEGDGLLETVKTDARGLAEIHWKVPKDVGSSRKVGPCSGDVAATLRVTAISGTSPELAAAGAVPKCLNVQRATQAIAKPSALVLRSAEAVTVEIALADGVRKGEPTSLSVSGLWGAGASATWIKAERGDVRLPTSGGGIFIVSASAPRADGAAVHASTAVLVKPRVLPKLTSRITGGRLAPGGDVEVEAKLQDEAGAPLSGSVTGILYDRFARADDSIPPELDTRLAICAQVQIEPADCDAVLARDPSVMLLLRAALSQQGRAGVNIAWDPGGSAREEMRRTFNAVLKNLEGVVFQSSSSTESLRDVMRKGPKGNTFNPEIMTLVTAVLATPPTTPGGEPFTLGDLRALDSQVEYDTVAKRVTRLKMFRILAAVRTFRNAQDLDANEPTLQDPNAILRRLFANEGVDEGGLDSSEVLDPWGSAMQFVKTGGQSLPFINAVPGWELHAPGPDGRIGTADDIKDPFVRVVKSGSPYARAMGEDKIVDSRLDMRVGEETVGKWQSLLTEFTGTQLSTGGEGFGSGHGRLGGSHRTKPPSVRMGATSVTRDKSAYLFSAPVRTDKDGIARLRLPLGADETTYRVLLVALPDGAGPAASTVDVATSLPLSVRVNGGTKWTEGDSPEVSVRVTNRTNAPMHATLRVSAAGAAELVRGEATEIAVDLPKKGAVTVPVRVKARAEGEARILADVKGGGLTDSIEHRVNVGPKGRRMTLARSRWVSTDVVIDTFSADDITRLEGAPSLLLEGSFDPTLSAIMDSLEPSHLNSEDSAADAVEVFERLRRTWEKTSPALGARASTMKGKALGRMLALLAAPGRDAGDDGTVRRARFWMKEVETSDDPLPTLQECPSEKPVSAEERIRAVEGEPPPKTGGVASCWDAAVSGALRAAKDERDPVLLAKLLLAFADRNHRESLASEIAPELARLVGLKKSGEVTLDGALTGDRAAKSIVYAALVRATALGYKAAPSTDTLLGWLLVQRSPDGGFGSAGASRAVVEALGALSAGRAPTRVVLTELDATGDAVGSPREVEVSASMRLPIAQKTRHVALHVVQSAPKPSGASPGFLARLDQRVLRSFSFRPGPRDLMNPLSIEVKWPGNASTESTASLEVRIVSKSSGAHQLWARIPLLPGASLAEPVEGVKQVDGALLVQSNGGETSGPSVPTLIPLRFAFGGEFTVPEATVRSASNDAMRARAMATRVRVVGLPKQHR